jgi:hypothetical protein
METHIPLPASQQVMITIGLEDELIDVMGRIVRSTRSQDNMYHNGIEFFHVPDEDRPILYRYVEVFHERFPDARHVALF